MSVFTSNEIAYMQTQTLGRLGTVGRDGQPHVIPLTYHYNVDEDSIDIGGVDFTNAKKWRDVQHNRRVTFLVDDASPAGAHAIEIRGEAEVHETGGSKINPRFPSFVEQFIRIRPRFIAAWGLDEGSGMTPAGFKANSRRVG